MIIPSTPLTDAEVIKTLTDMEDVIRYRLRMHEIIPVEMAQHRIGIKTSSTSVLSVNISSHKPTAVFILLFQTSLRRPYA
jgi:hypothetical protein